jgi:acyl-CoA synthetase (AMP-forming)/AMP-acid ligase II
MLRLYRILQHLGMLKKFGSVLWLMWCFMRFGTSLYTLFAWAAWRYPNQTALVAHHRLTFVELEKLVGKCASSLLTLGAQPNTSVNLAVADPERFVMLLLASLRLGLEVVLHNPKQPPTTRRLTLTDGTILPPSTAKLPHTRGGRVVLLTSGSTGTPKMVRQKRLQPSVLSGLLERLNLRVGQRILLTIPMFHGHGLATLALAWLSGSALFVSRFEAKTTPKLMLQERIGVLVLVPTILHRLLEVAPDLPLQAIVCGSAPLEPTLAQCTLTKYGKVLFNLYGSSEAGLISLATPQDIAHEPLAVGKPLQRVDILKQQVMVNGFATGDLGKLERGFLFLLGRNDLLLSCGGVNVHPHTIELQIAKLSYIKECAVVGVPDAEYGHAIRLFVVLYSDRPLETIRHDVAALLPKAQRPREVIQLDALPRSDLGKVQHGLLQQYSH